MTPLLPPIGSGRLVLERRARERRRLERAAAELGFRGLHAPGLKLSAAQLDGLATGVREEAARRKQPRQLSAAEEAVLFPRGRRT
jgi:hypothetical protein